MRIPSSVLLTASVALSICLNWASPNSAQDLSSGLEAYWTFDEQSGTDAADSSGNERTAEFFDGEPLWVEGVFGGALEFDGLSDMEVDWFGIEGAEPRSVSFWVKSDWQDIPGNNGIIGWGISEATRKYHIRFHESDGSIRTEPKCWHSLTEKELEVAAILF